MARYALFRLAVILPVTLVLMIFTFVVTQLLPTNPAVIAAGPLATPEQVEAMETELGLDQSIPAQLVSFLGRLVQGDLGNSIVSGNSVAEDVMRRLPSTLELTVLGVLTALVLALGLALLTAGRKRGPVTVMGRLFGGFGSSVPDFVIGPFLILFFYVLIPVFPVPIGQSSGDAPAVPDRTGAYLLDSILAGSPEGVWLALNHLALPVLTLALAYSAPIYRVAVAAIEDNQRRRFVDYVVLSSGSKRMQRKYVLENAAPSILTISGLMFSALVGGAVIVETIFSWGGLGQYAVEAITNNDFFAIQGFVLVTAVLSMLTYLAVDIVHAAMDPRVRKEDSR